MDVKHVRGKDSGEIFLYTLSTCGWCSKMKRWLDEAGLAYSYVDVDLVPSGEKDGVMDDVRRWNPQCTFPTVIVNSRDCFSGFRPEKLQQLLKG